MRAVYICVALLVAVVAVAARREAPAPSKLSVEDQFVEYVKAHNKKYTSEAFFSRFNAFKANLEHINEHNVKYYAGESSYKLGANGLADLTREEYKTRLGLRHTNAERGQAMPMDMSTVTAVPDSWDWRTSGAVNEVQDQGGCGSCWAFSATASLEATDFLQTNKLKKFSEQMCVDCVLNGTCTCDLGGEMHDCFVQVKNQGGEMYEKDYPYTEESLGVCHFNKSKAVGSFGNYVNVTQYDEDALKVAAYQMVVSVGIDASSWDFQLYDGGVYDEPDCAWKWEDLDHGVDVIGYGTDSESKADYWLVRNSWNSDWGLNGYIWMSRGKNNQCGIATDASYVPPQKASQARRRRHH